VTTILNGLLGGLAAGLVTAIVVRFVAEASSIPTLTERAVGSTFL